MKIALIGAGGKMGVRLANNLKTSAHDVAYVEVSEAGQKRLKDATGKDCVPLEAALKGAEAVVLAVPDTAIGAVAAERGAADRAGHDRGHPRRRGALCRAPAGARGHHLLRHPPLPSADLQRRGDRGRP